MTETKARKCGTKIRHESRGAAFVHLRRLVMRGAAKVWLNVYRCEHCDGYHVGHRPGRRKR